MLLSYSTKTLNSEKRESWSSDKCYFMNQVVQVDINCFVVNIINKFIVVIAVFFIITTWFYVVIIGKLLCTSRVSQMRTPSSHMNGGFH